MNKTNDIYKPKLQNKQALYQINQQLHSILIAHNALSANRSQYYLG